MADYSSYSYHSLLDYLANESKYDKDGVDYAEYLLSMSKSSNIDEMITVYNKVFEKVAYYVFAYQMPNYWFITESWREKQYLSSDLNKCFNENICRWYKSIKKPTKEDCLTSLVNLRPSGNQVKIQNEILSYKEFDDLHGFDIIQTRDNSYKERYKVRKAFPRTEEYNLNRIQYVKTMYELLSYGYKYSIEEEKFEGIRRIDINKEIIEVRRVEGEEQKERKLEEKRLKELRKMEEANKVLDGVGSFFGSVFLNLGLSFFGAILPFGRKR